MADDDKNEAGKAGSEEQAMADEWAAAMEEEQDAKQDSAEGTGGPAAQESQQSKGGQSPELDVILDIPVRISMEVGSTSITIRNLLQLNQGSVIELDRLAGEALDVLVNGTLIAHGEVVVVNDKFGIRMTDVISPSERIKKLR